MSGYIGTIVNIEVNRFSPGLAKTLTADHLVTRSAAFFAIFDNDCLVVKNLLFHNLRIALLQEIFAEHKTRSMRFK